MKRYLLFMLSAALCLNACKKDETKPTPTTPVSPYYFNFNYDGKDYKLNADIRQFMSFRENEAGGYQVADWNLAPAAGLRLTWPFGHKVTAADMEGLVGKTLYFNDTAVHPEISFNEFLQQDEWTSIDTADKNYSVTINSMTYLSRDTLIGYISRIYVVKGTCNAVLTQKGMIGATKAAFKGGEFNFRISQPDEQ